MTDSIRFPDGFLWGAATSAYQIEGSPLADGAGPSLWQRFTHSPGLTTNGDTGDIACDHYRRWESDETLVLAGGVPAAWLDGPGVRVRDLRTPYGRVSYTLKRENARVVLQVTGDGPPPGGFVFAWDGREHRFRELPATVVLE